MNTKAISSAVSNSDPPQDDVRFNDHLEPYPEGWLPEGIRSRFVENVNGLRMHVLEAGYEEKGKPGLLLLHGFPELAYSWRHVMLPLAEQGFHVIAPDQRGYGRTTGWSDNYDADLSEFEPLNIVQDALSLTYAMGHKNLTVVGHDFYTYWISGWIKLVPYFRIQIEGIATLCRTQDPSTKHIHCRSQ